MADYLKLFHAKRLSKEVPHHLEYIKGRLAHLKVEDPLGYKDFSEFYDIKMEVAEKKEVKKEVKKEDKKEPKETK